MTAFIELIETAALLFVLGILHDTVRVRAKIHDLAAQTLTGLGMGWLEYVDPLDREQVAAKWQSCLENGILNTTYALERSVTSEAYEGQTGGTPFTVVLPVVENES